LSAPRVAASIIRLGAIGEITGKLKPVLELAGVAIGGVAK
jgi:hypothetical protein